MEQRIRIHIHIPCHTHKCRIDRKPYLKRVQDRQIDKEETMAIISRPIFQLCSTAAIYNSRDFRKFYRPLAPYLCVFGPYDRVRRILPKVHANHSKVFILTSEGMDDENFNLSRLCGNLGNCFNVAYDLHFIENDLYVGSAEDSRFVPSSARRVVLWHEPIAKDEVIFPPNDTFIVSPLQKWSFLLQTIKKDGTVEDRVFENFETIEF